MPSVIDKPRFLALRSMADRLNYHGGTRQVDRMIEDKRRSMDKATMYSYQGAKIQRLDIADKEAAPALINADKTKQDYDDKILSVGWEFGYKPGDVFQWLNTKTNWIIYLQDLTELAYFRGEIRRCNYKVSWIGENKEIYTQYIAVRGPVETKINYIQKNNNSVDTPNYSLNILLTKTKEALQYFRRYSKFYLTGIEDGDANTCWRVEATDTISMPGIIELTAVEYYANEDEDDIENSLVGGLKVEPVDPNDSTIEIKGETYIQPNIENKYFYRGQEESTWSVLEKKVPVVLKPRGKQVTLIWRSNYRGTFTLCYGSAKKTIIIDSLF